MWVGILFYILLQGHLYDDGVAQLLQILQREIPELHPLNLLCDGIVADSVTVSHNEWSQDAGGYWTQRKVVSKWVGAIPVHDQSGMGINYGFWDGNYGYFIPTHWQRPVLLVAGNDLRSSNLDAPEQIRNTVARLQRNWNHNIKIVVLIDECWPAAVRFPAEF
jgi:hypothetical protein